MRRKAVHLQTDLNTKIKLYIDKINAELILDYIEQDERHRKKFEYIKQVILQNLRLPEVFDKEDINDKCKDVYAMKFFKGQENDRIYCKRVVNKEGSSIIIVASELHLKKKTQKNSKREKNSIEKVGNYEYDFEG